jgi:hypothetical protein
LEKKNITKKAGGVAQGVRPEFKPQYHPPQKKEIQIEGLPHGLYLIMLVKFQSKMHLAVFFLKIWIANFHFL